MKKILIILALLHLPTYANADDGIGHCFEAEMSNAAKHKCMIRYVDKFDNAITVIENDITEMIIHNRYIDIPQYTETKDKNQNRQRHKFLGTQILNEKKLIASGDKALKKDFILFKSYELQKQYALTQMRLSTELFNNYKEAECERVKSKYILEQHKLVAEFHKKLCQYRLSKERIKSLQESIK